MLRVDSRHAPSVHSFHLRTSRQQTLAKDSFPKGHHQKQTEKRNKNHQHALISLHPMFSEAVIFFLASQRIKIKWCCYICQLQKRTMTKDDLQSNKLPTVWDRLRSFNSWYSCREIQVLAPFPLQFVCLPHSDEQCDFQTWIPPDIYTSLWYRNIYHILLKKKKDNKLIINFNRF